MKFSFLVPTFNEEEFLRTCLNQFTQKELINNFSFEIIVSDSSDSSFSKKVKSIVNSFNLPITLLSNVRKGRSFQLNRASEKATGDVLIILHSDVSLPLDFFFLVEKALKDKRVVGGGCYKEYHEKHPKLTLNILASRVRISLTKSFWGNEAVFVRKEVFEKLGGFLEIPFLEDVDFSKKLKREGRVVSLKSSVRVSARRYLEKGILRQGMRNLKILTLHKFGISPQRLKAMYVKKK